MWLCVWSLLCPFLHASRYYKEDGKLNLDVGPFAKALEFATGASAVVIGKPSPDYFQGALKKLGSSAEEVVLVLVCACYILLNSSSLE